MKNFIAPAALVALFFTACSKSDDATPAGPSKADHLSASAWKLDAAGIDQDRNGTLIYPL